MHKQILALAALGAAASLQGMSLFTFDGSLLTDVSGDALPVAVSIDYAMFVTEDEFGEPLDTPYYGVDLDAGPVVAGNPFDSGLGDPIDGNALNAELSPVLFTFAGPVTISDFSATLDNSEFGTPPFFGTAIEFYGMDNTLIGSIAIDQTIAGFVALGTEPFEGVKSILFSSGAFYDNISMTVVPEPSTAALLAGAAMLGLAALRRRKA